MRVRWPGTRRPPAPPAQATGEAHTRILRRRLVRLRGLRRLVLVLLVPRRPPPSTLLVVARLVVQIRFVVSIAPRPTLVLVLASEPLPTLAVIVTVARAVLGILQIRVVVQIRVVAVRRVALGRYVVIRRVLALGADLVWMRVDGGVRQIMVARHGALCCCSSCCRCCCGCGGGVLNALG